VLTNSAGGHAFSKEVRGLLADELDLTAPAPLIAPDADQLGLSELEGTYESTTLRWQLQRGIDDRLVLIASNKEEAFGEPDPEPTTIVPAGPGRFLVTQDGQELEVTHLNHDGESYLYLGRLLKKTAGVASLAPYKAPGSKATSPSTLGPIGNLVGSRLNSQAAETDGRQPRRLQLLHGFPP
jgi:hypothetical protein